MTSDRGVDRVIRAWLDQMPDEAPDRAIDAALRAIETTPQVRRPILRVSWPLPAVRRFPLVAALAVMGALLIGAILQLGGGGHRSTTAPAPIATPTPSASSGAAPTALRGAWLADAPAVPELGPTDARISLVIDAPGEVSWIEPMQGSTVMRSGVAAAQSDLAFVAETAGSGCAAGDVGHYRSTRSADGLTLTLAAVTDACASRQSVLARSWVRSFAGQGPGGPGVVDAFDPMIKVTLPDESFVGEVHPDSAEITGAEHVLMAVKDPVGMTEPCSSTGGGKLALQPGADAFVRYMRTLPGFTVSTTGLTIDGHRAVHLSVKTTPSPACPSTRVIEWTPGTTRSDRYWFITVGDPDSLYLVEVGADLYLLQWLGAGVTTADEQALLSTVRFIEALPMAP